MSNTTQELNLILEDLHARNDVHFLRKVWHISMGLLGLWAFFRFDIITKDVVIYGTAIIAALGFLMDIVRIKIPSLNKYILKAMGPIIRKGEVNSFSGLPFYALGVSICFYFFTEKIAILSILFLVFSDPISSYFGIRYGTVKILPNKSIQGSVAGFCICYVITLIYCLYYGYVSMNLIFFALLAGVIGSVSELLSVFIDDNLTIPVVSGAGLTFLNMAFGIF